MAATYDANRIQEVFSDREFVWELLALEAPEDAQAALKAKGIELSIEELTKLSKLVKKTFADDRELSLDDLDSAAGGAVQAPIDAAFGSMSLILHPPPTVLPRPSW